MREVLHWPIKGEPNRMGERRRLFYRPPIVVFDLLSGNVLNVVAGREVEPSTVIYGEDLSGRRPVWQGRAPVHAGGQRVDAQGFLRGDEPGGLSHRPLRDRKGGDGHVG